MLQSKKLEYIEISSNLKIAKLLLENLINTIPVKLSNKYDIDVYTRACSDLGGDYYDFFYDKNKSTIMLLDISDHNLACLLLSVYMKAIVDKTIEIINSPSDMIEILTTYCHSLFKSILKFSTISLMMFYKDKIIYSNEGNNIVLFKKNGEYNILNNSFKVIGFWSKKIPEYEIEIKEDDILVICTDGLVDFFNKSIIQFKIDDLAKVINDNREESLRVIKEHIMEEYIKKNNNEFNDDITFILIRSKSNG